MFYDFEGVGKLINLNYVKSVELQLKPGDNFNGVKITFSDNTIERIGFELEEEADKTYGNLLHFLFEKGKCNDANESFDN